MPAREGFDTEIQSQSVETLGAGADARWHQNRAESSEKGQLLTAPSPLSSPTQAEQSRAQGPIPRVGICM